MREEDEGLRAFFLNLLYPRNVACVFCGQEAYLRDGLCAGCAAALRYCKALPPLAGLDGCASMLLYTPEVRTAIHRFKFGRAAYLAKPLAQYLRIPASWTVQVIVPVPLHKKRLAQRGFNQCALLGEYLGARYALPMEPFLIRARETRPQTELTPDERAINVQNAFMAQDCAGKRILLLDDIRTTGSTLRAGAKALRAAGAEAVYALTLAAVSEGTDDGEPEAEEYAFYP